MFIKTWQALPLLKMFKLKSMVNYLFAEIAPDNIFFKEVQSQTRQRTLNGARD
jgi:hypothetical protein